MEKSSFPLIVVDPRVTIFAQNADIHLPITPGTDVVLLNALMHVIFNEGLEDQDYIEANTKGFDGLAKEVAELRPDTVPQKSAASTKTPSATSHGCMPKPIAR